MIGTADSFEDAPRPWEVSAARVETARQALAAGGFIVVIDHEGPSAGGLVMFPAERVSADSLSRLHQLATGDIWLALTDERCEALGLPLIPAADDNLDVAPATPTIAARDVSFGVDLADHAHTMLVAIDPSTGPRDIRLGGHVRPLRAHPDGVLERASFTEAAVDLARLAGLNPSGVLGEIRTPDGHAGTWRDLQALSNDNNLPLVTVEDVIAYRRRNERLVRRVVTASLPTSAGSFSAVGYLSRQDGLEHLALLKGTVTAAETLVYIHVACFEGDVFRSRVCGCRDELDSALKLIEEAGRGVVIHIARDLGDQLQDQARALKPRERPVVAQILVDLGVTTMRVLTDTPEEIPNFDGYGLTIIGHTPLGVA